jgi:alpha-L-arabinofuranosidase
VNGGPVYNERYALFHDALKARYPEVELVADDWGGTPASRPFDLVDMHMYADPSTFLRQSRRFDDFDRQGPKVYFGEYAVTSEAGTGNAQAALAEAAFMTGLERNGDAVAMSSYAPLLSRPNWKTWNPNAIVFDSSRIYGTPSYHVQAMFGANRADRLLPVEVTAPPAKVETPRGRVGVGTWNTRAEYKEIKVTKDGQTLYASDFSKGAEGWTFVRGEWKAADGVLRQTKEEEGDTAFVGDAGWSDYTVTLKARKLGGREGFLVSFQSQDANTKSWWNLGGWGNTQHGLELPGMGIERVTGRIETGRWYDIKIELRGPTVKCYLD